MTILFESKYLQTPMMEMSNLIEIPLNNRSIHICVSKEHFNHMTACYDRKPCPYHRGEIRSFCLQWQWDTSVGQKQNQDIQVYVWKIFTSGMPRIKHIFMIKRQHLCCKILRCAFSPTTLKRKQRFSALTCAWWINLCTSQDVCFLGRHKWYNLHSCQSRGPSEPRAKGCASED